MLIEQGQLGSLSRGHSWTSKEPRRKGSPQRMSAETELFTAAQCQLIPFIDSDCWMSPSVGFLSYKRKQLLSAWGSSHGKRLSKIIFISVFKIPLSPSLCDEQKKHLRNWHYSELLFLLLILVCVHAELVEVWFSAVSIYGHITQSGDSDHLLCLVQTPAAPAHQGL